MQITADSDTARMQFNCYLNCDSQFKTMKFPNFVVLHYNFILSSFYDVMLKRDKTEIKFTEKEAKGDHSEKYRLNHPAIYFISSFFIILCTIVVFVFRSKN